MNVSFNQKAYDALVKLEKDSGIGKSEILRNAIALVSFIEEKKSDGYKIVTMKNGEVKQEIITP